MEDRGGFFFREELSPGAGRERFFSTEESSFLTGFVEPEEILGELLEKSC